MSTYKIESIGGVCPTQAEGTLSDGKHFYFRARHGEWTLTVAEDRNDVYLGPVMAIGDDPTFGSMSDKAVIAILDEYLG